MYGLHAIYDIIFAEIPYFAQLQPFDLVALDTDLQELWDTRINNVRMRMGWITQVTDSFMTKPCVFSHVYVTGTLAFADIRGLGGQVPFYG